MPLIQVIPLYNGAAIFGAAPVVIPKVEPLRDQRQTYPGVNGVERIIHGTQGATIQVSGVFVADDVTYLGPIEQIWRDLQIAGTTATLIDTAGIEWPDTFLETFEPDEEIKPWIGDTGVSRKYKATFRTLS
jgi:hypothetical protein